MTRGIGKQHIEMHGDAVGAREYGIELQNEDLERVADVGVNAIGHAVGHSPESNPQLLADFAHEFPLGGGANPEVLKQVEPYDAQSPGSRYQRVSMGAAAVVAARGVDAYLQAPISEVVGRDYRDIQSEEGGLGYVSVRPSHEGPIQETLGEILGLSGRDLTNADKLVVGPREGDPIGYAAHGMVVPRTDQRLVVEQLIASWGTSRETTVEQPAAVRTTLNVGVFYSDPRGIEYIDATQQTGAYSHIAGTDRAQVITETTNTGEQMLTVRGEVVSSVYGVQDTQPMGPFAHQGAAALGRAFEYLGMVAEQAAAAEKLAALPELPQSPEA
jgi:hypothetical protein